MLIFHTYETSDIVQIPPHLKGCVMVNFNFLFNDLFSLEYIYMYILITSTIYTVFFYLFSNFSKTTISSMKVKESWCIPQKKTFILLSITLQFNDFAIFTKKNYQSITNFMFKSGKFYQPVIRKKNKSNLSYFLFNLEFFQQQGIVNFIIKLNSFDFKLFLEFFRSKHCIVHLCDQFYPHPSWRYTFIKAVEQCNNGSWTTLIKTFFHFFPF